MRISDWSSDVCSSDLHVQDDELRIDDLVEQADRLLAIARTHHREPRRLQHVGVHAPELVVVFGQDNRSDGHRNLNGRSEEHTSELQALMRLSYAVFCLKKKKTIRLKLLNLSSVSRQKPKKH